MPDFFKNWLESLSPQDRDAMWGWADETVHIADEIIEIVGTENGSPNVA